MVEEICAVGGVAGLAITTAVFISSVASQLAGEGMTAGAKTFMNLQVGNGISCGMAFFTGGIGCFYNKTLGDMVNR